jgi:nucleoside-diphosphate-sugar epimerase
MNILLTGSKGFLGSYLFKYLSVNHTVFTLNRSLSDYNCDLSLETPLFDREFDLVIHAAGKAHFDPKSKADCELFNLVNVEGTLNLLKGLTALKIPPRFVYISSVSVYGLSEGLNITENFSLNALDYYGRSKIITESIISNWCKINSCVLTILRPALIVGVNPPGNLGKMINAIKKGYYFNILNKDSQKSMVLANDIASFLLPASECGGIYNLTDGYHPSFFEISKKIAIEQKKRVPLGIPYQCLYIISCIGEFLWKSFPLKVSVLNKMVSNLTFDDSLARKAFKWNPKRVVDANISI